MNTDHRGVLGLIGELTANDMRRLAIYHPRIARLFRDVVKREFSNNNITYDEIQAVINMR